MTPTENQITASRITASTATYDSHLQNRHEYTEAVIKHWESIRPKDNIDADNAALRSQMDEHIDHHTRSIIAHEREAELLRAALDDMTRRCVRYWNASTEEHGGTKLGPIPPQAESWDHERDAISMAYMLFNPTHHRGDWQAFQKGWQAARAAQAAKEVQP
jgi:hypothetical protein